ncbi:hypothetical protein BABINDRAFT_14095 [Babjeviella inositovora NRRL Y-12698]|uniref:Cullin family profile domain-containing protein n=1 Tax=Babjeviella inositovora NRRL Y-12698 TaxID=984486 RepID=A0A1E3QQ57_9ASCO|nr:uncharacterized protein BABINDRAFT_14095 [Babjeviella inositovora NRRL Y-12698]ODQ79097.1 hypothetical protein BABINDRAFT_14095 [Babjeviella inositovora NRRL Y-12698]
MSLLSFKPITSSDATGIFTVNRSRPVRSHLEQPHNHPSHNPPSEPQPLVKRVQSSRPTNYADAIEKLDRAVDRIFENEPLHTSYEALYRVVEYLCRNNKPTELYVHIKGKLETYFGIHVTDRILETLGNNSIMSFLGLYRTWEAKLAVLSKVYMYLDKTYLLSSPTKLEVRGTGLKVLVDDLLAKNDLGVLEEGTEKESRALLMHSFSELMESMRVQAVHEYDPERGIKFDPAMAAEAREFLTVVTALDTENNIRLEEVVRVATASQYRNLLEFFWENWPVDYILYVSSLLDCEITFFAGSPTPFVADITARIKFHLLYDDAAKVLPLCMLNAMDGILDNCVSSKSMQQVLYFFTTERQYLPGCIEQWGKKIHSVVDETIKGCRRTDPSQFIRNLMTLQNKFMEVLRTNFSTPVMAAYAERFGDAPAEDHTDILAQFDLKTRQAFREGVSLHGSFVVETLCKYVDSALKAGSHGLSEALDLTVQVYNLMREKAIFYTMYRKDLSRRLVLGKSRVEDETQFLEGFKAVMDDEHYKSLFSMLTDIAESKEYAGFGVFEPLLVRQDTWVDLPVFANSQTNGFKLPPPLAAMLNPFNEFYQTKYKTENNGRNLTWVHYLNQITLTVDFPLGKKDLSLNTYQAAVLMLFLECDALSTTEIEQQSGLNGEFLDSVMASFTKGKYVILVQEKDGYRFNTEFQDKLCFLKVGHSPPKPQSSASSRALSERSHGVNPVDVQWFTESYIAKCLKNEESMPYTSVVSSTILQCRRRFGVVELKDIKKVVETLIEKGYIQRLARDASILEYVP